MPENAQIFPQSAVEEERMRYAARLALMRLIGYAGSDCSIINTPVAMVEQVINDVVCRFEPEPEQVRSPSGRIYRRKKDFIQVRHDLESGTVWRVFTEAPVSDMRTIVDMLDTPEPAQQVRADYWIVPIKAYDDASAKTKRYVSTSREHAELFAKQAGDKEITPLFAGTPIKIRE